MEKNKILITTGGTGGHIFPALALKKRLEKNGYKVILTADIKFKRYKEFDNEHILVPAASFYSKSFKNVILTMLTLVKGFFKSLLILLQKKPDVIIGFGGYATYPMLIAAAILKTKVILHESNTVIGKVNRIMLWNAKFLATGFRKIIGVKDKYLSKVFYTGNPIREEIANITKDKNHDKFVILVIGGSQGAKVFSTIVPEVLINLPKEIKEKLIVYQQAKEEDIKKVKEIYAKEKISCEVNSFFTDMEKRLSAASILIARSGASTIAELIATSTPAILIPLPSSADNHQYFNAKEMENAKACWLAPENKQINDKILSIIKDIDKDRTILDVYAKNLSNMNIDACNNLINLIKIIYKS